MEERGREADAPPGATESEAAPSGEEEEEEVGSGELRQASFHASYRTDRFFFFLLIS